MSSITGWRKFSFIPENDGDYSALDVLPKLGTNVHSSQLSEELRLASPTDGAFQYLAGLQFF
jgi:iron complex outermembrane receptor protein